MVAVTDYTVLGRLPVKYAVGSYSMNTTLTNIRDRFGQRGPGLGVDGSGRDEALDEALIERHGFPSNLVLDR
jgi:hypothetical protein